MANSGQYRQEYTFAVVFVSIQDESEYKIVKFNWSIEAFTQEYGLKEEAIELSKVEYKTVVNTWNFLLWTYEDA